MTTSRFQLQSIRRSPSARCSTIPSTRRGPKAACRSTRLRAYARQYFHHVEAFPRAVSAVHSACPDRDGRRMLAENLAEEEGIEAGKQDHATLWLMFACGLGESEDAVRAQELNAETQALIETFRTLSRQLLRRGPRRALRV